MTRAALTAAILGLGLAAAPAASARTLSAPKLSTPAADAAVQQLPTFAWRRVKSAAQYEFQLAADRRFDAIAVNGHGQFRTRNTAATVDQTVPNGTYYWRGREIGAHDKVGKWSTLRTLRKAWTDAPQPQTTNALAVSWPATPLVLRWSPVPYAARYFVTVATDEALSNPVIGSVNQPLDTQATVYALPGSLAPGRYFWAITPVDAEGHLGARSRVSSFDWSWPTATATRVNDLDPSPEVVDPQFSWDQIPGAARYEVEVNTALSFPAGSKWCCSDPTIGTSLSPTKPLANNRYFWRVRPIDSAGNAGQWNEGPAFDKTYDRPDPGNPNDHTIESLTLRTTAGAAFAAGSATDTPLVTWDPVPGATRYEVQTATFGGPFGCDYSGVPSVYTPIPAWTPRTTGTHYGPQSYPDPPSGDGIAAGGARYCFRVLAQSADDGKGGRIISGGDLTPWTDLGGAGNASFQFNDPPAPGPTAVPFSTPDAAYISPAVNESVTRTPYFTWNRVSGAQGYYVIVSRDAQFTKIADIGFTTVPAYAPRQSNNVPLSDETSKYYWYVVPTLNTNGTGNNAIPTGSHPFDKNSVAPTPTNPAVNADIVSQPTFTWTAAEGALEYRLQVSQDPTFANTIDDVTTTSTAYTSSSTYPPDTALYWRVRANDILPQGLNWSATQVFRRRLPTPVPAAGNLTSGEVIPVLSWSPVPGAVSYDMHVDQVDATTKDFTVNSTSFTPVTWYGQGIWKWKIRANFPGQGGGKVSGPYSSQVSFVHFLAAPKGAKGTRTSTRMLISWNADPAAKRYAVDLSATNGFGSTFASVTTDHTSWAPDLSQDQIRKGGTIYWRVVKIDEGNNRGAAATGRFKLPRAVQIELTGLIQKGRRGTLGVRVRTVSGSVVRSARVTVSGAGIKKATKRTSRKGRAKFSVRPKRRGKIVVTVKRSGYQSGRASYQVG